MFALVARPGRLYYRLGALGDIVTDLSQAIARFEGFNVAGSVAQRNNNPGNLRSGPGMTGTDASGYAVFPSVSAGWSALYNQVSLNISRGLNLNQFFGGVPGGYPGYAPSSDNNNPANYAATVGGWIGVNPTVPLSQYVTGATPATAAPSGAGDVTGAVDLTSAFDSLGADVASLAPAGDSTALVLAGVLGAIALVLVLT